MTKLSIKEARKIVVQSQKLAGPANPRGVSGQVLDYIRHLGYIQLDTISVIERAHHHVLWSRVKNYKPRVLHALERKKLIFEYWSHAASYLPMDSYRYTLPVKQAIADSERWWQHKNRKEMARVLDHVHTHGATMSRDLEEGEKKVKKSGPVDWGPNKWALYHLFMEGKLMITKRDGFQKVYDLPERWLPPELDQSMPSRTEYIRFLIHRDLKAHGLMKENEIGYLLKGVGNEIRQELKVMLKAGEIIEVEVMGRSYYSYPQTLDLLHEKGYRTHLRILSPFDNLAINRKRTLELFDLDYKLECYVPRDKRIFGYFGLILIWGHELIGQVDLKADRQNGALRIRNFAFKPSFKRGHKVISLLKSELERMREFNGCSRITLGCDPDPYLEQFTSSTVA